MKFIGFIRFYHELEGTKSEGDYAYLEVDENTRYRLYSAEHMAQDSEYLRKYEDMEVSVEGEVEDESLCINSVNDEKI